MVKDIIVHWVGGVVFKSGVQFEPIRYIKNCKILGRKATLTFKFFFFFSQIVNGIQLQFFNGKKSATSF